MPEKMEDVSRRRTLLKVLLLNVGLTITLTAGGIAADSTALLANALDNASDAVVYALSYFAVSRTIRWKTIAATVSGVLLIALSVGMGLEVVRRFTAGAAPVGGVMIGMALFAAAINAWCLRLLAADRRADVNFRAAWTFSINDFLSNAGILVAGGLVWLFQRGWPDVVVGFAIAAVAAYGGLEILRDARRSRHTGGPDEAQSD